MVTPSVAPGVAAEKQLRVGWGFPQGPVSTRWSRFSCYFWGSRGRGCHPRASPRLSLLLPGDCGHMQPPGASCHGVSLGDRHWSDLGLGSEWGQEGVSGVA